MTDDNQSRESSKVGAGIDAVGNKQHLNVDATTRALLVAIENLDIGIDLQVEPLDYKFQNLDESGDPAYYGYVRQDGKYYIMKLTAAGVAQYFKSDTDTEAYDTAWTARAAKTYTDWDGAA